MLNLFGAWVGAAIVIAPCLCAWIGAALLVRSAGTPFLPERLHDYYRAVGVASWFAVAAAALTTPLHTILAVAAVLLTVPIGMYPLSAWLFGDRWGVVRYAAFQTRRVVAFYGYWLLFASGPSLVLAARDSRWLAAYGLTALLLLWGTFNTPLSFLLLGARPLRAPDLDGRFREIAARSRVAPPLVMEVAPRAGSFWNAYAFPGHPSRILFGRALLDALTADESTAIFAHELAHIEQAALRRRSPLVAWLPVLAYVFACCAAARLGGSARVAGLAWGIVAAVMYVALRGNRQRWEADADRRAAELCGDAAPVARALTRVHTFARVPRRWAIEHARSASHPDLAARVAALGSGGGGSSGPRPITIAFSEPPGAALLFEAEACHWRTDQGLRSFGREEMVELAVAPSAKVVRLELVTTVGRFGGAIPIAGTADLEEALVALEARIQIRHRNAFGAIIRILRGLAIAGVLALVFVSLFTAMARDLGAGR